jgi:tartrate-resistant acid phosphatase type 5
MMKLVLSAVALVAAASLLSSSTVSATLSFATIGDWGCVPIGGWHEQDQLIVAKQFAKACEEVSASFVLNPGDNFYYCGITKEHADWWNTTFENVYGDPALQVPFFNALGNHDYGYPDSATMEMNYRSPNNNRWILPDRYYYRRITFPGQVNISLVVLDSSPCQSDYVDNDPSGWDPCGSVIPGCPGCTFHENVIAQSCSKQRQWLQSILPTIPEGDWKLVLNHAPALDIDVDDLISDLQNANIDMYINGHVHLMGHYQVDGKGTYITSGGGCMVRVPDSSAAAAAKETPLDREYDNLEKVKRALKDSARKHKKPEMSEQELNAAAKRQQVPPGDLLMNLRKDKRASLLGATSCPHETKSQHTCSLVYQKTVAGYTTHSFSEDYQTLYTYMYNWEGVLLHQLSVKKGTGGGAGSTSGSGSAPAPPADSSSSSNMGGCCKYDNSGYCPAGQECCSESGHPYDHYDCDKYGRKHACTWDSVDGKCIVH